MEKIIYKITARIGEKIKAIAPKNNISFISLIIHGISLLTRSKYTIQKVAITSN
jgi:hypothetical protein